MRVTCREGDFSGVVVLCCSCCSMSFFKKLFSVLLIIANLLGNVLFVEAASLRSNQLGQNLLVNSNLLGGWANATRTLNTTETIDPWGTYKSMKIVESSDVGSVYHYMVAYPAVTPSITRDIWTVSIYAKAATLSWIEILDADGGQAAGTYFDVRNGVIGNQFAGSTNTITPVGNGWYRCTMRFPKPYGFTNPQLGVALANGNGATVYQGDGTKKLYLAGGQMVFGDKAGAYNPTFGSARNTSYAPMGAARTSNIGQNLISASERLFNTGWSKTNVTIEDNTASTADPFGGNNASKMTDNVTTGVHRIYNGISPAVPIGAPHVRSIYAKAGTLNWLEIETNDAGGTVAYFNLATGAIGTVSAGLTAKTQYMGNGWYRCSVSGVNSLAGQNVSFNMTTGDGVFTYSGGTGTIFIYGAQANRGISLLPYNRTITALSYFNSTYVPVGAARSSQLGQNLLTNSDPATLAQLSPKDQVTVAPYAWPVGPGLSNAVSFGDNSILRYAYQQFSVTAGTQYTLSYYVQMEDNTIPIIVGQTAPSDFVLVWQASVLTGTATPMGNGVYRVTGTAVATVTGVTNFGAVKYTTNSTKSFKISGYQLVKGAKPGAYNKTTSATINASYSP